MKRIISASLLALILILSFSAIQAVDSVGDQPKNIGYIWSDGADSCTIEIDSNIAAAWGAVAENTVSTGFMNGTVLASNSFSWEYQPADQSGRPGYWYIKLNLAAGWARMWEQGDWMRDIVFTNCPEPTEPSI